MSHDCPITAAVRSWHDKVSLQEEYGQSATALSFTDTAVALGMDEDHIDCLTLLIDTLLQEGFDQRSFAETFIMTRSAMLQLSLVAFTAGRITEGVTP